MTPAGPTRVIETGIRAVDLYAPLIEGGLLAITGTAGAGQVVLALEIAHNLVSRRGAAARFTTSELEPLKSALRESRVEATVRQGTGPIVLDLQLPSTAGTRIVIGEEPDADSWAVLTVELLRAGQLPALDPIQSGTVAELGEHGRIASRAREVVVAASGARSGSILAFSRQWFHVTEPWTGQPAEYTTLTDTLATVQRFLGPRLGT